MNPEQTSRWITAVRWAPYIEEAGGDHDRALALYVWNAQISAALFETLHHVEVTLRNAIDAQFQPVVAAADPAMTWLCDPGTLSQASRSRVTEIVARIERERHAPTRARVVAGLGFGFWRALFDRRYHQLWATHLHRAFPAGSGDRSQVADLMSKLVPFRNRVAHHETIIRKPIERHYDDMLTLAGLIDPDVRLWIDGISRVRAVLQAKP